MPLHFESGEPVAKAIPRMGRIAAKRTLKSLRHCDEAEAIHDARKNIKRARALLRMVQPEIKSKSFQRSAELLRKAAKPLAPPRDAFVLIEALQKLVEHADQEVAPRTLRRVRQVLLESLTRQTQHFVEKKGPQKARRIMRRVEREMGRLVARRHGWKTLAPGIKKSYSRARRVGQQALREGAPHELLHEWRKRSKDVWYQLRMLRPICPEELCDWADQLKALTECLGDSQDLLMLEKAIDSHTKSRAIPQPQVLKQLIESRRRELQISALAMGERFYAAKPSTFCRQLAGHWHDWRDSKEHS